MPRRPGQSRDKGAFAEIKAGLGLSEDRQSNGSGYEVESVCVPCLGMLQGTFPFSSDEESLKNWRGADEIVTCAPVSSLRTLPLKRLKEYLAAYNIPNIGPKEKEDFVQAIMKARNPQTGALSPEAEVSLFVEDGR